MAFVAAAGAVQKASVVPHNQHVRLPAMAVDKVFPRLVMEQANEQVIAVFLAHTPEALNVSNC